MNLWLLSCASKISQIHHLCLFNVSEQKVQSLMNLQIYKNSKKYAWLLLLNVINLEEFFFSKKNICSIIPRIGCYTKPLTFISRVSLIINSAMAVVRRHWNLVAWHKATGAKFLREVSAMYNFYSNTYANIFCT